jgi:hypothetical protein
MPLLIDIEPLSCCATDHTLEFIYKAIGDPPDDGGIWEEHPSPFVRRLIELFTQRGLSRISGLQLELARWLDGKMHREGRMPARPEGATLERWSPGELALAKLYLESLKPSEFSLDDWMMVCDYLVQKYLPHDALEAEAEWLSVRSTLMGRVQADMGKINFEQADKLVAAMPNTLSVAEREFELNRMQGAVIQFGVRRCAENVVQLAENARRKLRRSIMSYQEAVFVGGKEDAFGSLQTKLLDDFGVMNRDWRRIAMTEAAENQMQGLVASVADGTKMKRIEHYRGVCPFCKKIDGKVVDVVSPDHAPKDPDKQVWVGKNNVGRSASPRRRVGGILMDRTPDEMWWMPAGPAHPHCRGTWLVIDPPTPDPDSMWGKWLSGTLNQ